MKAYLFSRPDGLVTVRPEGFIQDEAQHAAWRRAIDGAVWFQNQKRHAIRPDQLVDIISRLERAGFEVDVHKLVQPLLERELRDRKESLSEARDAADEVDQKLRERGLKLFPFQKNTIEFLAGRKRSLNALEQGLGKTVCSLVSLPYGAAVLVICPKEAKGVWMRECAEWRPDLVPVLVETKKDFRLPCAHELIVANFDIVPACPTGSFPAPLTLIVDEVHKVKDPRAQRSIRTKSFSVRADRVIGLTGTPLPNNPPELWGVLSCLGLEREVFGSKTRLMELFGGLRTYYWTSELVEDFQGRPIMADCEPCEGSGVEGNILDNPPCPACDGSGKTDQQAVRRVPKPSATIWGVCPTNRPENPERGWILPDGACRTHEREPSAPVPDPPCSTCNGVFPLPPSPEIASLMQRVAVRFEKKDVLQDLPPKIYKVLPCPLTKKQVKELVSEIGHREIDALLACDDISQVVEGPGLMRGRKLLAAMKISFAETILDEWEADNVTSIVFSVHRDPILKFSKRPGWTAIIGGMSDDRDVIQKDFQAGKYRGLAATIGASSTALTLTRASRELFLDRSYVPAENEQSEDRAHRIGQTAGLLVYDVVADHAVDHHIHMLNNRKRKIINATIGKMAGYKDVDLPLIKALHKAANERK